jgi:dihydrofolate synthase/folylpolyglutamate synthase
MARRPAVSSAEEYLATRARLGIKFGLETMRALLEALGRPDRAFPVLLVAGTNGKGSVVAYLDAILRAGGLRVGRYTSPHLVRVHERIVVGGRAITSAGLERAVQRVRGAAEDLVRRGVIPAHPTYFEAVTAAALEHFRRRRVQVALLEVGMGARLDATNTTEPLASAIVSIARDHEMYLGDTLDAIAREKAGVLRAGRATVLGPLTGDARAAIAEEAARVGSLLVDATSGVLTTEVSGRLDVRTPSAVYRKLRPLPGAHQRANLLVALRLLEAAHGAGLPFDPARRRSAVALGVRGTRWPGRLQRIAGRPSLLLDGAHNPEGARALAEYLEGQPPHVLLFGAMADKDVGAMGRSLFPRARAVVLTRAPGDRSATPDEIVARTGPLAEAAHRTSSVAEGLRLARRLAGPAGLVVVAGSLYVVGEVLRVGPRPPRTPRK